MAFSTLAPVDVCNVALSKIGAMPIQSMADTTNQSAIQCTLNFQLAYLEVSRSAQWNCLLKTAILAPIAQTPLASLSVTPPTYTTWAPLTLYQAGVYVTYGGLFYSVPTSYTSSASFATDLAAGHLVLYNTNGSPVSNAVPWAPLTYYQANAFVTYGGYYYTVLISYTSTNNFTNDVTAGFLAQTDQQAGSSVTDAFSSWDGSQYASGWGNQYQMPSDFELLAILNSSTVWDFDGAGGSDYQLQNAPPNGLCLFTSASQAVIQYIPNQPDTTQFDPLFLDALTYKLAAAIATPLRQDGGAMQEKMMALYERQLMKARVKDGGEHQVRRFNPIRSSRFNQARYGGSNG